MTVFDGDTFFPPAVKDGIRLLGSGKKNGAQGGGTIADQTPCIFHRGVGRWENDVPRIFDAATRWHGGVVEPTTFTRSQGVGQPSVADRCLDAFGFSVQ